MDVPVSADTATSVASAEKYVIGAILQSPSVLRSVMEEVVPADFEDIRLGAIYGGICRMQSEREPIDYMTVWEKFDVWDVRGVDLTQLGAWMDNVPTVSNASYYAGMVRRAALRRELQVVATQLREDAAKDETAALERAMSNLTLLRDRDLTSNVVTSKTLREILDVPEHEDAYDWVVPGLLERSDRLMLTGIEGGGKSTLLRQVCVLTAAGLHPFQFVPVQPIKVVVIDAENSERQWRRAVRSIADEAKLRGARDPGDSIKLRFMPRSDVTRADVLGSVHKLLDQEKPDLLMIGPLYRLTKGSINNDDDAAPVLAALDSIRDRGVAMLIEAHAGHAVANHGERDLRPRGSSALLGWPEFGLGLRRAKEVHQGRVAFELVKWRGDRDARAWPTRLSRHPSQVWPWEPAGQ